jgi:hypothetical protein
MDSLNAAAAVATILSLGFSAWTYYRSRAQEAVEREKMATGASVHSLQEVARAGAEATERWEFGLPSQYLRVK